MEQLAPVLLKESQSLKLTLEDVEQLAPAVLKESQALKLTLEDAIQGIEQQALEG